MDDSVIMRRLLEPFLLTVTAILMVAYGYVTWRLATDLRQHAVLAIPFVLVWVVPAMYWGGRRREQSVLDKFVLQASFLSMGWLSFLVVLTLVRDAVLISTMWSPALAPVHAIARDAGIPIVFAGSLFALLVGALRARRGPRVHTVEVAIPNLHPDLVGFRIAQVTDLHVGRNIRRPYVERVVALTKALEPDLVALTGDMVDGSVERLADDIAPLSELARKTPAYFVLGNHDCYSGPQAWSAQFRKLGFRVLLNDHATLERGRARIVVAGVLDPTLRPGPRPDVAIAKAPPAALRLLLAHNPQSAPAAERAGFDLQLSGHTHGGQFFPWTLVVRRIHGPHHHGLSKRGRMWVYVSPGTGTWGPPVRLGTRAEVTLIRLVRPK
jgi:predicted MPP superfamily phosphohydrolase